jgi:hypothetical protein
MNLSRSTSIGAGADVAAGSGAGSGEITIGMNMAKSFALMSLEDAFMARVDPNSGPTHEKS